MMSAYNFLAATTALLMRSASPARHGQLVYEVLARVNASDHLMEYRYNPDRLKKRISEATDEEKTAIVQDVLECIEFKDQYNTEVNSWLKKQYPGLCEKLGIVFVED